MKFRGVGLGLMRAGLLVALAGCGGGPVVSSEARAAFDAPTIELTSDALSDLPVLRPEITWVIGRADDTDATLFDVRSMDTDSAGTRLFVLDAEGIRVFSADGSLERSFGPRGNGPGELMGARSISIHADTVFVLGRHHEVRSACGTARDRESTPAQGVRRLFSDRLDV